MFQRFKNALDQLEEQARKPTPSLPPRNPPQRRVQSSSTQRASRGSQDVARPSPAELAVPDPDPSTFDPDFVVGDDTPSRANTPTPRASQPPQTESQPTSDEKDDTPSKTNDTIASEGAEPETKEEPQELPQDVQAKLRKLTRLESKYQDLLKAYRKAHTRNSVIEPFEAKLREVTPLTSIAEPEAFVELINQMTQRTGMVMNELKRVSTDRDSLKGELEEARKETTKAYDEVTKLRSAKTEDLDTKVVDGSDNSRFKRTKSDAQSASSEESPISEAENASKTGDADGDLFSVDNEVPRLEAEIADKTGRIASLESENYDLKKDLNSAQESAQHMMKDLESAQSQLDGLKHEHARGQREAEEKQSAQLKTHDQLKDELSRAQASLKFAEERTSKRDTDRSDMIHLKEKEIETLKSDIKSISVKLSHATKDAEDLRTKCTSLEDELSRSKDQQNPGQNQTAVNGATTASTASTTETTEENKEVSGLSGKKAKKRLEECLKELAEKTATIDGLKAKLKDQEDLVAEIETLRGDLSDIGSEHVDAKHELKTVKDEKEQLAKQIKELETKSSDAKSFASSADADELRQKLESLETRSKETDEDFQAKSDKWQEERAGLEKQVTGLQDKVKSLEKDLAASQTLASNRFKEVQTFKERIQKIQPELGSLRTEVVELRNMKKDLGLATSETKKLEARSQNLRAEIEAFKKRLSDKDNEIKTLNDKLGQESSRRMDLEESSRKSQREAERLLSERSELTTSRESLQDKFTNADREARTFKEKSQRFENELNTVRREVNGLREEMELKSAQQASAQSLMNSVRDQASEMAVQMKEAQQRYDSLEEELADAHRLMSERSREGETMRRLISDVERRAESRVKEMKERMELAIQERDRAEDDASNSGRRRAREVEELRNKVRDAERELRTALNSKDELSKVETELRRLHEEDARRVSQTTQEMEEVKRAMGELRDTLDEGERQSRELEEEKNEVKRSLDDAHSRIEKLQKTNKTISDELRSLRANRIKPSDSPSTRSSFDGGSRLQSPASATRSLSRNGSSVGPGSSNGSVDYVYLKNILLQFLEQKDKKNQMQLVPVLGKILHFDKTDEQRWSKAVNTR